MKKIAYVDDLNVTGIVANKMIEAPKLSTKEIKPASIEIPTFQQTPIAPMILPETNPTISDHKPIMDASVLEEVSTIDKTPLVEEKTETQSSGGSSGSGGSYMGKPLSKETKTKDKLPVEKKTIASKPFTITKKHIMYTGIGLLVIGVGIMVVKKIIKNKK